MLSRVLKVVLLVVVSLSIVACSATPTRRSFKEGWKDSVISTKVKLKLTKDKLVRKRNFDVDTWRGVVTMTGRVTSVEEKERAEQLAWQVNGVRGVDNYLKLVEDAYLDTGTAVAKKSASDTEKVVIKETVKTEITSVSQPAAHPAKSKVSSRVDGPVVFEENVTDKEEVKLTAKRGRYSKPETSGITEEDLTSEERLAQDAADELRKLRGEDVEQ